MSLGVQRLAGVALLVVISLTIVLGVTKPNPVKDTYRYWAVFDTVHGLGAIDRDVRIAGVKLGEVGKVERVGDDVRVELKLSEDYPVHTDARADMRPHTLFEGSNFIDLAPGSPSAPLLRDGGEIPVRQTTNYVTLDKALRVLRPEIRTDLRRLARVGGETLRGEAITGLQTTLKNAPAMARALAPAMRAAQGPQRRELVGSIRGLARTADALASERDQLIPLTRRVNATMAALSVDGGAPLDAALAELPATLERLNGDAPALDLAVRRLATFSSRLGATAPRAVARALKATTPILTRSAPILKDGTPVVRDARLVAGRLAAAKGGLTEMLDALQPALKTFPPTLEALNARTSLGASSGAFQLVAGAFTALDGAVSSFQTPAQNPSAPGHRLRVNVNGGDDAVTTGLLDLLGGGAATRGAAACEQVRRVSPEAVAVVRAAGGCR
ncbi:MlaD family protein [Paraconexibacter algicola]|nr:MlaD family protein [Paraconexibacter algicola]